MKRKLDFICFQQKKQLPEFSEESTRDSQKVCGHLYLLSHLSNVFKFYFIFRKRCFHSLIYANIKQITAVVPEQIDFEYFGVAVAGHVKFEIDVIRLYQETGQK